MATDYSFFKIAEESYHIYEYLTKGGQILRIYRDLETVKKSDKTWNFRQKWHFLLVISVKIVDNYIYEKIILDFFRNSSR